MLPFIVRRLLIGIPLLIASSILVFALVANAGTPQPIEDLMLRQPPPTEAQIEAAERNLGLDKPWYRTLRRLGLRPRRQPHVRHRLQRQPRRPAVVSGPGRHRPSRPGGPRHLGDPRTRRGGDQCPAPVLGVRLRDDVHRVRVLLVAGFLAGRPVEAVRGHTRQRLLRKHRDGPLLRHRPALDARARGQLLRPCLRQHRPPDPAGDHADRDQLRPVQPLHPGLHARHAQGRLRAHGAPRRVFPGGR